jgi:Cytidylyltransferase family
MVLLVIVCQTLVYREVTALFSLKSTQSTSAEEQKGTDPWRKTLNWYFFAITNYFLYGESIIYYFKVAAFLVFIDKKQASNGSDSDSMWCSLTLSCSHLRQIIE